MKYETPIQTQFVLLSWNMYLRENLLNKFTRDLQKYLSQSVVVCDSSQI